MDMSSSNEQEIEKFLQFCASDGLTEGRISKYGWELRKFSGWLGKGFREASREDIEGMLAKLNEASYAKWTKRDYKIGLKKFYKWLEGDNEEYPKKVRWIKCPAVMNEKSAADMLTQEEVRKLIEAATNVRDKAIISVLYESGCRIAELMSLRIRSVQNMGNLVHIHVTGKTGSRPIPLVTSIPYLSIWMENHPTKKDPESMLFVSIGTRNNSKPVCPNAVRKVLISAARSAGITRKVNPHNFRHTRATHLAKELKEPEMRTFFGWSKGSDMPATYVHLSGRDIDNAILQANGLKKPQESDIGGQLLYNKCPRCDTLNGATAGVCSKCMLPLDEQSRLEQQRKMSEMLEIMNSKGVLEAMIDELVRKRLSERETEACH